MIHQQAVMLAVVQRLVATQILEIQVVTPNTGSTGTTSTTYTVKSGDSVWGISNSFWHQYVTVDRMEQYQNNFIYPGQNVNDQRWSNNRFFNK